VSLQTYDPTIEDAYRKQMIVDNRMSFVEVIDTAGQGEHTLIPPLLAIPVFTPSLLEEYATLRDQWVR
jgi:GTPase KRas protein